MLAILPGLDHVRQMAWMKATMKLMLGGAILGVVRGWLLTRPF